MGYSGSSVPIPLGQMGLHTDDPMNQIPPNAAIVANNLSLFTSRLEKSAGSQPYQSMASLGAGVVGVFDWLPQPSVQRLIAITSDGKVWRDTGDGTFSSAVPIKTGLGTLTPFVHMTSGGAEEANRNKKLFAYTSGTNQIQVIDGDVATMRNIRNPAADWTASNYPTFGFIFQGRHFVFGSANNRHTLYWSGAAGDTAQTFQGNVVSGSATMSNVTNLSGITVGSTITGNGIPPNTTIVSINLAGNSLVMSNNATSSVVTGTTHTSQTVDGFSAGDFAELVLGSTVTGSGVPGGTTIIAINTGGGNITLSAATTTSLVGTPLTIGSTFTTVSALNSYQGQDHENFIVPRINAGAASPGFQTVFSGEGDAIIGAFVYKGVAMIFKRPFGVYILDFQDTLNYSLTKYSDAFGIASPHACCQVVDDLVAGNNSGSLTSLKATQAFGSFETGDILNNARVRDYVRTNTDVSGLQTMHSCYYPEKEVAYFTTKSSNSSSQDRMIVVDVSRNTERISIETKDQPSCMGLRKDANNVLRPMYGALDGKIYLMDQPEHTVGGTPYIGEFQTPYVDFSYLDATLADKVKLFDFLTVSYVGVGAWSFYIDVSVDGTFIETIPYMMTSRSALGSFVLDRDRLANNLPQTLRKPMHCAGKSISFRIYNGVASEYFKIDKIIVSFRLSSEQNKSSK